MKKIIRMTGKALNLEFTRTSKATLMTGDTNSIRCVVKGIRTILYALGSLEQRITWSTLKTEILFNTVKTIINALDAFSQNHV